MERIVCQPSDPEIQAAFDRSLAGSQTPPPPLRKTTFPGGRVKPFEAPILRFLSTVGNCNRCAKPKVSRHPRNPLDGCHQLPDAWALHTHSPPFSSPYNGTFRTSLRTPRNAS